MRLFSLHELLRLTRAELFALHQRITRGLAELPPRSSDRQIALTNQRNVSRVLSRYEIELLQR